MQEIRRYHDGRWYSCRPAANGIWYIHWSENRRSRRETTGATEAAAADAFFHEWLKLSGPAEAAASFTCAEIFAARYGGKSDEVLYDWPNLAKAFGALRPADVTQALVDKYIADRKAGRAGKRRGAASTIRRELANLYASWRWAAKPQQRLLTPADLPALDPPPPPSPRRERWLSDDELERFFAAAAGDEGELFAWVALDTAGRREAVAGLTWAQIDFEAAEGAGVVHLNPEGRVQTRKRRASVPMSPRLREVLLRARRDDGLVCGFSDPRKAYRAIKRIAARAGLKGVTPHVLRHTAATHMARRGVSLWIIAQVLGNRFEEVERTYAKYAPSFAVEAVGMIGGPAVRPRAVEAQCPRNASDKSHNGPH